MSRKLVGPAIAVLLCCAVSFAFGAPKGKGGGKPGGAGGGSGSKGKEPAGHHPSGQPHGAGGAGSGGKKSLGGAWSGGAPSGGHGQQGHAGNEHNESGHKGAAAGAAANNQKPHATGAEGAAAAKNKKPPTTGAEGAAAGAAAANNKKPSASGAEGAAAGAAAANKNKPKATGAEGAAAGAAASNRNNPKATGAEGAAAGAAAANRNNPAVSGAAGAAAGAAAVRNSFAHPDMYGEQWYGSHQNAWAPAGWAAGAAWAPTTWGAVAGHCGYASGTPVSYNYGTNVTYEGGNVVVDGQSVGTAEEFGQQAVDLAETGAVDESADAEEWLPLGVFAMVRNEHQHPHLIVQLAINAHGGLRGNYTDEATDHTLPVRGAVDKDSQRAAWTVGDNKNSVMEAGLANLTAGDAPALIHKDGKTEQWLLVRLEQPDQGDADAAPADGTK